jgi:magnesium transporter
MPMLVSKLHQAPPMSNRATSLVAPISPRSAVRPRAERVRSADATAADHLLVSVPVLPSHATAAEARAAALANPDGGWLYALDSSGALSGILSLTTLLALHESAPIAPHLEPPPPGVAADADQELVAMTAVRYSLAAIPVHDPSGRFLGVVPASALLRVLHHEHVEDLDRLFGVLRQKEHVTHAFDAEPSRRVAERLPWLLVGLCGSALATWVMASFEASLQRRVAVAFFVPGIVYLADAIGTQTEAAAVRSLSFQCPRVWATFLSELRTGLLLGLALALPVLPAIGWAYGDFRLAAAVALAILFAGTLATAIGFLFPLLLARCNRDPALGSGPLATIVQDVLSLMAYFMAVEWLMPG